MFRIISKFVGIGNLFVMLLLLIRVGRTSVCSLWLLLQVLLSLLSSAAASAAASVHMLYFQMDSK